MSPTSVTVYKTTDGTKWETAEEAAAHEDRLFYLAAFRDELYHPTSTFRPIECEEIIQLLVSNPDRMIQIIQDFKNR